MSGIQGYKISGQGPDALSNTSTTLGGSHSTNQGQRSEPTTAEELGITRGNDGSLGVTQADSKRAHNLIPNPQGEESQFATGGRGGDEIRQPIYAHDVSLPPTALHMAPQSNEQSRHPPRTSQSGQARDERSLA